MKDAQHDLDMVVLIGNVCQISRGLCWSAGLGLGSDQRKHLIIRKKAAGLGLGSDQRKHLIIRKKASNSVAFSALDG
ncbi:MAG: hypothetical protein CL797_05920 [Chromatiales bacterium]|jgi:hypothetical protein|nr:hypothetical protein [Chromatiales bacterium]